MPRRSRAAGGGRKRYSRDVTPLFGADTHPRAVRILVEGYRRMTPEQKLGRVVDLTLATHQLAEARLRAQYPAAGEREIRLRLAALIHGRDVVVRAFGWDPDREGW